MLSISFLGKTKIEYKGKDITELLGNKTIALICMLAINDKKFVSREKVITYLWPDSNENAAKYNMRFNLWLIKKNIGTDEEGNEFLYVDKESCAINEKYEYTCDILKINRFKPREQDSIEDLSVLRELFIGEFLEGCYFNNCEEFNELILFERLSLEKKKVAILKRLAELYENQKQYNICLELSNEIQEIEPYDEEVALKIMNLYAVKGNNAKAINYYNIFSNTLATSLGISPGKILKKRYDELKCNHQDSQNKLNNVIRHNHIEVCVYGIKGVKFFTLSQIIEQILEQIDIEHISKLTENYIHDLWYIQREIANDTIKNKEINKTEVAPSDSCVINAFIKFIKVISSKYYVTIKIDDYKNLDEISYETIRYLKELNIKSISIK